MIEVTSQAALDKALAKSNNGANELIAVIAAVVVFVLLTLLPAIWAIAIFCALAVAVVWFAHHRKERTRRRIQRLEEKAELERRLIRAEGERRDALRVVGGIERGVPR